MLLQSFIQLSLTLTKLFYIKHNQSVIFTFYLKIMTQNGFLKCISCLPCWIFKIKTELLKITSTASELRYSFCIIYARFCED